MMKIVFALSLLGTIISLYFSDVLGWEPCILCWYQRIALYPIVVISLVAIVWKDQKAYRHILGLSIVGAVIALVHNLLYWGVISEQSLPCKNGVSCVTEYMELFGFITIPLLSLATFVIIAVLMFIEKKKYANQ